MSDIEIKKEELKAILKIGYKKPLSVEEAKKRLKESDPDIDIGKILKILNTPSNNKLKLILIELLSDPEIISYFSPVIKEIVIKLIIRE